MPTWQGFINFRCESIRSGFGWGWGCWRFGSALPGCDASCRPRPRRNHCLPRNFLLHGGTPLILGYTTTTATPSVRYPCSSQKSFNVRADTLRWLRFRVYLPHRREYKRERLLRCSAYIQEQRCSIRTKRIALHRKTSAVAIIIWSRMKMILTRCRLRNEIAALWSLMDSHSAWSSLHPPPPL